MQYRVEDLVRYNNCPHSYMLMVGKKPRDIQKETIFASVVCNAIVRLWNESKQNMVVGALSESRAMQRFTQAWQASGLSGAELHSEGESLLRKAVVMSHPFDHAVVERAGGEIMMPLMNSTVIVPVDRIDRNGSEAIVSMLDMSYSATASGERLTDLNECAVSAAVMLACGWANAVTIQQWKLIQGKIVPLSYTEKERRDAVLRLEQTVLNIEKGKFQENPNSSCTLCDVRMCCGTYREQVLVEEQANPYFATIDRLVYDRERISVEIDMLTRRKREIDQVLKSYLAMKGSIQSHGYSYHLEVHEKRHFDLDKVADFLAKKVLIPREEIVRRVSDVDNKKLDKLVRDPKVVGPRDRAHMVQCELEKLADIEMTSRIASRRVK